MNDYEKNILILGLNQGASLDEIKSTYKELAQIFHPDKCKSEKLKKRAEIEFKKINEAYHFLLENHKKGSSKVYVDDNEFEEDFTFEDNMGVNDVENVDEIEKTEPKEEPVNSDGILRPVAAWVKFITTIVISSIYTIVFFQTVPI